MYVCVKETSDQVTQLFGNRIRKEVMGKNVGPGVSRILTKNFKRKETINGKANAD